MINFFEQALKELVPNYPNWYTWIDFGAVQNAENVTVLPEYESIVTRPTNDQINAKVTELENAEPMRILRKQRNRKLAETDWWCTSDRTPTQAQLDYRTALRDLPSTASPSLDENGNLTGVEWPTKPE